MVTLYQIRPDGIYVQDRHYDVMPDPRPARFLTVSPHPIPAGHFAIRLGGQWRYIAGNAPTWRPDPGPPPPTMEEAQYAARREIDVIRDQHIFKASIPYTFPGDTEPDGVQLRDERDRQNIQDNMIDAAGIKNPDDIMYFMPTSNQPKTMTATQMLEMGAFLKARGDAIYGAAWTKKAEVAAATTLEELRAIDLNAGWPE